MSARARLNESRRGEGEGGNRKVSPTEILGPRAEACLEKEGGPWGKHGFPHGSKPEADDTAAIAE